MRSFLRTIWKTAPKSSRPPWREFCEKVRDGKIKIVRKRDLRKLALDKKAEKE